MTGLSFPTAFAAGLLSFASPCVLPLVPSYLTFLAGVSLDELKGEAPGNAAVRRVPLLAGAFVLGFGAVFTALGATASLLGRLLLAHLDTLALLAGVAVIVMGLQFLGVFRLGLLQREARFEVARRPAGLGGAFVVGLAFAFAWTPCIGPVLGAILGAAAGEGTAARGAALLATYAAGLGVPFLAAGAFAGPFLRGMARLRARGALRVDLVQRVLGAGLVVTGVLMLTGGLARASYWLLETFPALGRLG